MVIIKACNQELVYYSKLLSNTKMKQTHNYAIQMPYYALLIL